MHLKQFTHAGHPKTLFSAFVYFDFSFMVWAMLGALGNFISQEFNLQPIQKGLMTGLPLLSGSLLRLVVGPLADRHGAKKVALLSLGATFIPLLLGGLATSRFENVLIVGLLLGIAGASFAVALPMVSRWYPPKYQGLALGITGAGNSGTVLAALVAPRLANAFGDWRSVFLLALLPCAVTWLILFFLAKEAPNAERSKSYAEYTALFRQTDTWVFGVFYMITFGGFVGLASFLPIFFNNQYALDKVSAGNFAAACAFAGSFIRPLGGFLADRLGGIRLLTRLFGFIAIVALAIAQMPSSVFMQAALIFLLMTALGCGNGSVFQIVPQRFPKQIGTITSLVGAIGGVGGFLLPNLLGSAKQITGSFGSGFVFFALAALVCLVLIFLTKPVWERTWTSAGGKVQLASD